MSGGIPSELGLCTLLSNVELQQNQLSGEIPLELETIANVTITFNASENALTGVVPEDMVSKQIVLIEDVLWSLKFS